jgi:MoxR-like ATPase
MSKPFLSLSPGSSIPLPASDGMAKSVHIIDEESILAVNAALATGRPLLVRGEPGTGKSQLARAAAEALRRTFVSHAVDSRTETRDLLWSVDAVARLAEAQMMGALTKQDENALRDRLKILNFVQPGPLWWAFDWSDAAEQAEAVRTTILKQRDNWKVEDGVVVLLDEIDKADPSVPNALLDALGHGRFEVPGRTPVVMQSTCLPLVVITTNEERALPDAFLRRCLVLHLSLPTEPAKLIPVLVERGRAHFPADKCADAVLAKAAELLANDRPPLPNRDLSQPGLAEYIDLLRAVSEQKTTEEDQCALLGKIAKFALKKHPTESNR